MLFHLITVFFLSSKPCIDIDEWVTPCTVNYFVPGITSCDEDIEELQNIFFYQVK